MLWAYLTGVIVTVVAALAPARRATHIPPVAALRDDVALPASSLRRRAALGTLVLVAGLVSDDRRPGRRRRDPLGRASAHSACSSAWPC